MKRGRDTFKKFKPFEVLISSAIRILPVKARIWIYERLRNEKGLLGIGLRYIVIKTIAKNCGDNVSIFEGCFFRNISNISFGNNVSIWPMCYIDAVGGGISIGDNVSIAHGVSIIAFNHKYEDADIPIKDQGVISKRVVISDNVWIGAKATVLCGRS